MNVHKLAALGLGLTLFVTSTPAVGGFDGGAITTAQVSNVELVAPSITNFGFGSTGPYEPGQEVVMDWVISDGDGSGLAGVTFYFMDPIGNFRNLFLDGTETESRSQAIQASWASGTYVLDHIVIENESGAEVTYNADGTVDGSPGDLPVPETHAFNFASTTFVVNSPSSDTDAPSLESLSMERTTFFKGETIVVSYVAGDDGGSGVSLAHFDFEHETTLELIQPIVFGAGAAAGPATEVVPESYSPGKYRLTRVVLNDYAFLRTFYNRDYSVDVEPAGATPPTITHSLDLPDFDITIVGSMADATCDGSTDMSDVLKLRRMAALLEGPVSICSGDADDSGEVDGDDALLVLKILAGLAEDVPVALS